MFRAGYFDQVRAQLETTVGAHMSGVVFKTSTNALDPDKGHYS